MQTAIEHVHHCGKYCVDITVILGSAADGERMPLESGHLGNVDVHVVAGLKFEIRRALDLQTDDLQQMRPVA